MADGTESRKDLTEDLETEAGRLKRAKIASGTGAQRPERKARIPQVPTVPDLGDDVIGMYYIG